MKETFFSLFRFSIMQEGATTTPHIHKKKTEFFIKRKFSKFYKEKGYVHSTFFERIHS